MLLEPFSDRCKRLCAHLRGLEGRMLSRSLQSATCLSGEGIHKVRSSNTSGFGVELEQWGLLPRVCRAFDARRTGERKRKGHDVAICAVWRKEAASVSHAQVRSAILLVPLVDTDDGGRDLQPVLSDI